GGLIQPVVEIEVVEQSAPGRGPGIQTKAPADAVAQVGHQYAVMVAAHPRRVLGQGAHGLDRIVGVQIGHKGIVIFAVFKVPHRGPLSFHISRPLWYRRKRKEISIFSLNPGKRFLKKCERRIQWYWSRMVTTHRVSSVLYRTLEAS